VSQRIWRRLRGWRVSSSPEGMVPCPVRGESDVERCVGCPYLQAAEVEDGILRIQCRPVRTAMADTEILSSLRL